MEFGSTSGGKEKEKVHKMSTEMASEDTISSKLPESVISHILSYLPTKEAVRTCVLSKRWMIRWTSITTLDFDDSELCIYPPICDVCKTLCTFACFDYVEDGMTLCRGCFHDPEEDRFRKPAMRLEIDKETGRKMPEGGKLQRFVNFVRRVVLLTNNTSSSLERFSFVICNKLDVFLLNTWISAILNRRVKSLRIHSSIFQLPFSAFTSCYLFNSTSLEELELLLYTFSSVKVPVPTISFHFGHLKLLNLSGIFFMIDPSTDSMTLSLPLLKKFAIKNCIWSKGKDFIVQAPLLETLSIEQDHYFFKLESLSHDPCSQSLKFNLQQHLKEFTYSGCGVSHQIHLSDPKFLSHVSPKIILKECEEESSKTRRLPIILLLLQQFHQVKCIKFEALDLEILTQVDIPVFPNLSHLELNLVTVEVLIGLLQKSPLIKTLVLKGIPKFAKEILNSTVVPHSLASSLQVLKFEQVNGEEHELFLANFFMKNGMMLEKVGFSLAPDKSKVMEEFKEKMYSFKKGFSFVVVEL